MNKFEAMSFIDSLSNAPGVYEMFDGNGKHLYVGKAGNLKNRVASYFRGSGLPPKTLAMMRHVTRVETTVTRTENEALLLENNLIKRFRPRYNVVWRDDKSYPYIHLDDSHQYPRLGFYRGNRREAGSFFGPYANAGAVRSTLSQLQKVFPVRQCEDTFYRSRSRPCLQYQIKRCSAPCVGLISPEDYHEDVKQAVLFLEGKDKTLNTFLEGKMEAASERLDFETAARYRDRIAALRRVQEHQYVAGSTGNVDLVALHAEQSIIGAEVVFVRGGRHSGNKSFIQPVNVESTLPEIMTTFLAQFYLDKTVPKEIIVRPKPSEQHLLEYSFSSFAGRKVRIVSSPRGARLRWLEMAMVNAEDGVRRYLMGRTGILRQLESFRQLIDLDQSPGRIECFDVSHTAGEAPVASCVVFDREGPVKSEYRRYNIKGITPGDDYAALTQTLQRRYRHVQDGEGKVPDIILIDGGKGQLAAAKSVLDELQIAGVTVIGVAKGPQRQAGMEKLFLWGHKRPTILPADSSALHLIQKIRDEAHRFAISGHRRRRDKGRGRSTLEDIPGVGEKRRRALLRHLGGLQEVSKAGIEDLAEVPGISPVLAERIYAFFHDH
jgi:excinuclease ABC subunit C